MKFEKRQITYCIYRVVIEDEDFKEVFWVEDENCEINDTEHLWYLIVSKIQCVRKENDKLYFYKDSDNYSDIFEFWFELPLYKDPDSYQIEYNEAKSFALSLFDYISLKKDLK